MNNTDCGNCGKEDCDPIHTECCGIYMCQNCYEYHMDFWYEDQYLYDNDYDNSVDGDKEGV